MIARSNIPCLPFQNLLPLFLLLGVGDGTLSWGATPDMITLRAEPSTSVVAVPPSSTGSSVAINERWILLGQPTWSDVLLNAGGVQVHRARDGQKVPVPLAHQIFVNQLFGYSVALCGDIALVGAPGENANSGAVYLFDLKTGNELARIDSPDGGASFGRSIAVSQNWAVVGAPAAVGDRGAAYVFDIASVAAGQAPVLIPLSPPGAAAGDAFGRSVAIYDRLVLVGAPGDDAYKGAAFVFGRQGNLIEQLVDVAGVPGDEFGYAVALNGLRAAISAPVADSSTGKVLLFEVRSGHGLIATLTPILPIPNAQFGVGLTMSEDLIFVNNYESTNPVSGFPSSPVEVFRAVDGVRSGGLRPPADFFGLSGLGASIAVEGNRLLIGSPFLGSGEGAALYLPHYAGEFTGFHLVATGDSPPGLDDVRVSRIGEGSLDFFGAAYCTSLVGKGAARGRNKALFFGVRDLAGQRRNLESSGLTEMLSLEKPFAFGGGVFYEGRATRIGRQVILFDSFNGARNIFGVGKIVPSLGEVQSFQRRVHSPGGEWAVPVKLRRGPGSGITGLNDDVLLHLDADGVVVGSVREGTPAPVLVGGELIGPIPRVAFTNAELDYPVFLRGATSAQN